MAETRRNLFKTSILSVFGLISGTTIIKSAAAADPCPDSAPVLVRLAQDGYLLLTPQKDGSVKVTEVNSSAIAKRWPFNLRGTIDPKPILSNSVTADGSFKIGRVQFSYSKETGTLSSDTVGAVMALAKWNEIGGAKFKSSHG